MANFKKPPQNYARDEPEPSPFAPPPPKIGGVSGDPQPSIGRIVLFRLTEEAALYINHQRRQALADAKARTSSPLNGSALDGEEVRAGMTFPMIVTAVFNKDYVNGQVFLDGNDSYWAENVGQGQADDDGSWHWPPRA